MNNFRDNNNGPNEIEEYHGYARYWEKIVDKTLGVFPWVLAAFSIGCYVGWWFRG